MRGGLPNDPSPETWYRGAHALDESPVLAEADHRIANHLALLTSLVRMKSAALASQTEEPNPASVRLMMDSVVAQINAVAMLHRLLSSDRRIGPASLGEHLHEICAAFASGLSGRTEIVEDISLACAVGPDQIVPLGQIVAEVITNAAKHASLGGDPVRIVVRCQEDGRRKVRVEISDNGPGFPATFDPETNSGLGFRLLRALGRRLGARIRFRSNRHGVRFRLTMSAPPPGAVAS